MLFLFVPQVRDAPSLHRAPQQSSCIRSDLGIRPAIGSLTLDPGHRSLQVDPVRVMGPGAIRIGSQAAGLLGP